jgi:membrane protein required for colicin V production
LSVVDIILTILILAGAYSGYKDGTLTSLFSLVAVVMGLLLGFKLMGRTMVFMSNKYNVDEKILPYIAFGVVFVVIVIIVNVLGRFVKMSIDKPILGMADKTIGAGLGAVQATFMISIMIWIADSLRIKLPEAWVANAWLQPEAANFAPGVANWIGEFLPIFKDVL